MTLKLYNTLTRQKEVFRPLDPSNVRMYVCGPTVYDYAHIGNARPVIVFDVLFRLLRHLYGADHVTYVRNITDVDDKINARAAEEYPDLPLNEAIRKVTEKTEKQFHEDVAALGCLAPTREPRATEHIEEMKVLIERLVQKGCAYVEEDHVLFRVAAMQDYGRLSRRSLDEMIAGARVDVAPYKRDPMDFVLWKPSKEGEPQWSSPCGIEAPGRPGWHIECSAMAWRHLGETFDIHGGGIDLIFPHHENEIAQTRCALGHPFMAQTWMHNGFLQVEGKKMAKSEGNFVTIRELLRGWKGQPWSGATVRWAMLQTHYRQPIDWTQDALLAARNELWRFFALARRANQNSGNAALIRSVQMDLKVSPEVLDAISDDLNTPEAIAILRKRHELRGNSSLHLQDLRDLIFLGVVNDSTGYILSNISAGDAGPPSDAAYAAGLALDYRVAKANSDVQFSEQIVGELKSRGYILVDKGPDVVFVNYAGTNEADVSGLIAARNEARKRKNWTEADRIRAELDRLGILLKDSKDPKTGETVTTWEVKR